MLPSLCYRIKIHRSYTIRSSAICIVSILHFYYILCIQACLWPRPSRSEAKCLSSCLSKTKTHTREDAIWLCPFTGLTLLSNSGWLAWLAWLASLAAWLAWLGNLTQVRCMPGNPASGLVILRRCAWHTPVLITPHLPVPLLHIYTNWYLERNLSLHGAGINHLVHSIGAQKQRMAVQAPRLRHEEQLTTWTATNHAPLRLLSPALRC